jgi:hypothetical protein
VVPDLPATVESFFVGVDPFRQSLNSDSSFGLISAIVVSPTMTIVALLGLNHASWNLIRSSRVIFATPSSYPDPENGRP